MSIRSYSGIGCYLAGAALMAGTTYISLTEDYISDAAYSNFMIDNGIISKAIGVDRGRYARLWDEDNIKTHYRQHEFDVDKKVIVRSVDEKPLNPIKKTVGKVDEPILEVMVGALFLMAGSSLRRRDNENYNRR